MFKTVLTVFQSSKSDNRVKFCELWFFVIFLLIGIFTHICSTNIPINSPITPSFTIRMVLLFEVLAGPKNITGRCNFETTAVDRVGFELWVLLLCVILVVP